jgi:hypothetical protein
MIRPLHLAVAALLAVILLINGTVMLLVPEAWYWQVPGVADRGPFNQHFIRDIGIVYCLMGVSFMLGLSRVAERPLLWLAPSCWLAGHALFHIWEVLVGICSPTAMLEDFAGVTLPALLGLWLWWSARGAALTQARGAATGV